MIYTERKHQSKMLHVITGIGDYFLKLDPSSDKILTIERITWMGDMLGCIAATESWMTVHQRYDPPAAGIVYIDGLKYFKMSTQSTPYNNHNEELNLTLPGGTPIYIRYHSNHAAGVTMLQLLVIYREERIDAQGHTHGGEG